MSIWECGVPDDPSNPPILNFTTTGQRWNRTNLTYRFGSFTPDIPQADVQAAIRTAFNLWSNVTPLTFTEINTGTPDILLNFVASIPGATAARATWNFTSNIITDSQIIFDDSDIWALVMPIAAESLDLVDFAAHEIGHCLGLHHSQIETAIMRKSFDSGTSQRSLAPDDINGIQSIYGARFKSISRFWPGMFDSDIDAAVEKEGIVYFFKGSQYTAWVVGKGLEPGGPKSIARFWPGMFDSDIDAAVEKEGIVYFFKGSQYTAWVVGKGLEPGGSKSIARFWPGMFDSDIDAAVEKEGIVYFFKGSQYTAWVVGKGLEPGGPKSIARFWPGIFDSDINAAVEKEGIIYFFKGSEYTEWKI